MMLQLKLVPALLHELLCQNWCPVPVTAEVPSVIRKAKNSSFMYDLSRSPSHSVATHFLLGDV